MKLDEAGLKQRLRERLDRVYLLYGDEPYLIHHYRRQILRAAVPENALPEINLHEVDGQTCRMDTIPDMAETLPMMAEHTAVSVRDPNLSADSGIDAVIEWLADPPEHCTVVFWMSGMAMDARKSARFKALTAAVDKVGAVVTLDRKEETDIVRLLVSGASRRGCTMPPATARLLIEQCGDDLYLLLGELDKLCAVTGAGEITADTVRRVGTYNLEARVFDLSKAMMKGRYDQTYALLNRLRAVRAEPIPVLATLAAAFADVYRAKVAAESNEHASSVADYYNYRNKAFRLKYAAQDAARFSIATLRALIDLLAEADTKLKSTSHDPWLVLEQTAAAMISRMREADAPC